jgi:signal transduction histidine kinase
MRKALQALARWFRTLQAQLILWAILPVTLVVIALSLTGVYTHQRAMRDFVVERNRVVVRLLAHRLEDGLAYGTLKPDAARLGEWLHQEVQATPGALIILDTSESTVLFSSAETFALPPSAIIEVVSQHGDYLLDESENGPTLFTFAPVRSTDWLIVLQEPVQAIVGPILRFANLGPVVALVAAGLSTLILTFGWRTIVHPLRRLAHTAAEISGPDTSSIQRDVEGVAEIQDLQQALQAMVARIEGYEAGVRDYLEAVTQGQEAERARVARDIHDGPVQGLIALSQRSEILRRRIEEGETQAAVAMLESLRQAEVEIVEELRRIIGALRPIYLEDLGFQPALEMLVHQANARSEAGIRLEAPSAPRRLDPEVELAAYRIAQEALNNAVQHAQADHIFVRVAYDDAGATLVISDDGVGFELAERLDTYTQRRHFGLVGLQERVRQLDGALDIDTEVGGGTTLTVRLPDRREPTIHQGA